MGLPEFVPSRLLKPKEHNGKIDVSLSFHQILKLLRTQEVNESNLIDEKKSDVFAFGITLFSAVMLRSPFESDEASDKDMLYKYFYSGET